MVRYSLLIKNEIDKIRDCGALTALQSRIFDIMLAGRLTRNDAADELGMSYTKFHAVEKELNEKIKKILQENPQKPPHFLP